MVYVAGTNRLHLTGDGIGASAIQTHHCVVATGTTFRLGLSRSGVASHRDLGMSEKNRA
jgi:hypothetical protein